jgi:hypothetical protein
VCISFIGFRVVSKYDGESIAARFHCVFCETTAVDDYEYVQQLFHRSVREVRKERQRMLASNIVIDSEQQSTIQPTLIFSSALSTSLSSSSSSSSSSCEIDEFHSAIIPIPPPIPATLARKAAVHAAKTSKSESIQALDTSTTNSSMKSTSKRTSVFSKIFK